MDTERIIKIIEKALTSDVMIQVNYVTRVGLQLSFFML